MLDLAVIVLAFLFHPVGMLQATWHCQRHRHRYDIAMVNFRFGIECGQCGRVWVDE